jgi:hypothetical protein
MSITVFGIVLVGALLHATWNAIIKGAGDKLLTTILVTISAGFLAAATLPFVTQPAAASWPFIATSVVLQIGYFVLVVGAYRVAVARRRCWSRWRAPLCSARSCR